VIVGNQLGVQQGIVEDLLDGRFVLLTGSNGMRRYEETGGAAGSGVKLAAYRIGSNGDLRDPQNEWARRMGVSTDGAVLIRPDGFVAWRSRRMTTHWGGSWMGC
jgi:putative polyketide hydroxylase